MGHPNSFQITLLGKTVFFFSSVFLLGPFYLWLFDIPADRHFLEQILFNCDKCQYSPHFFGLAFLSSLALVTVVLLSLCVQNIRHIQQRVASACQFERAQEGKYIHLDTEEKAHILWCVCTLNSWERETGGDTHTGPSRSRPHKPTTVSHRVSSSLSIRQIDGRWVPVVLKKENNKTNPN